MFAQAWLTLALALHAPVTAAEEPPVKLQWSFKEGDVFYIRNDVNIKQTISGGGRKVDQNIEQSALTRFTVKKKNADKSVVLEQTFVDLKGKADLPGFDDAQKKMKGASLLVTLNDRGEPTRLEGYKDLLDKLADGDEKVRAMLATTLSEDVLKQTAYEAFSLVPNRAVKVGNKWERKNKVSMGPIGDIAGTASYTYAGTERVDGKNLEKIGFTGTMKYAPPGDQPQGAPFKIVKADLKVEEFKGTLYFDARAGRLTSSGVSMRLTGSMTMSVMGNTVDMEIEQDLKAKSRVATKEIPLD